MDFILLAQNRLVRPGLRIEIRVTYSRDGIITGITRYQYILERNGTGHALRGGIDIPGFLRIISLEIQGKLNCRCLHEFQITLSLESHLIRHGIIGIHRIRRKDGRHGDVSHRTGITCRFSVLRHIFHLNGYRFTATHHPHIPVIAKEIIEETAPASRQMLPDNALQFKRFDHDIARMLGEKQHFPDNADIINLSVICFTYQFNSLRRRHLLRQETVECRKFTPSEIGQIHLGIYLDSRHQALPQVKIPAGKIHPHEQILLIDSSRSIGLHRPLPPVSAGRRTAIAASLDHLDGQGIGLVFLAIHQNSCRSYVVSPFFHSFQYIGVSERDALGGFPVNDGERGGLAGAGPHQQIESFQSRDFQIGTLLVNRIRKPELLTGSHH